MSKNEYLKENEAFVEIDPNLDVQQESTDPTRRDFLKLMGFSFAVGTLSACSTPPRKVIPYLNKPEEITPGTSNWYASTCHGCTAGCGVLVKQRDGRPIKIEGNKSHPLSQGGVCAVGQASVLSLYDSARLRGPQNGQEGISWGEADSRIRDFLGEIRKQKGKVAILSETLTSPSSRQLIKDFTKVYPNTKHVTYDAVSYSAIRKAHKQTFNKDVLPSYRLDKADIIVNFGADFLSTWLSPVEFNKQYSKRRKMSKNKLSRHIQFESRMSLTGSNADVRIPVEPAEQSLTLLWLLKLVAQLDNRSSTALFVNRALKALSPPPVPKSRLESIAAELWKARKKALVLSGSNDVHAQVAVTILNSLLRAYPSIIDIDNPSYQKQGDDSAVAKLVDEMNRGKISALIVWGVNPLYSYPQIGQFETGLKKVSLKVSFSDRFDETASQMDYVCPANHYLEAWDDAQPTENVYSLTQPVLAPIFNTRTPQESILKWIGDPRDYYSYVKAHWKKNVFTKQTKIKSFQKFWDTSVHDGVFVAKPRAKKKRALAQAQISGALSLLAASKSGGTVVSLYQKAGLFDGKHANNPWLQELPDPVTKISWDNYVTVSPQLAKERGIKLGDVVRVKSPLGTVELPVVVLPGQSAQTLGIAVGYGRSQSGPVGNGVGKNVFSWTTYTHGTFQYQGLPVTLEKTPERKKMACTQLHQSLEGRDIVKEALIDEYKADHHAQNKAKHHAESLWREHKKEGSFWGMAIDLNSCNGCSACVVACQAENNVPSVGQKEVAKNREMHWLRIDRYYKGDDEKPEVVHQPMLCQHCEHAPCETVCPTLATVHSSDGLNMQAYNRCVGTRYCANNCPYKVRRFNWFNYDHSDLLANMVLNPDIVVRSRGVMEKCSMCVQRIQDGERTAKKENRSVRDGDIQTACQQSCPADAIVFGDMNDPKSKVSKLKRDPRNYRVLAEIKTLPTVSYLTKVRNRKVSES